MADHQSSYTGAQLDSAIAAYVNRSAGSITLDKDNLSKSIGGGYYSGVTAAFDGTGLNATGAQILTGYTAVTSGGKTPGQMQSGTVSLTLTPSSLTPSTSPNKFVTSASASLDYSSLTAKKAQVLSGYTFIGKDGVDTGSLVASQVQTGEQTADNDTTITITGLTGTPSNLILMYTYTNTISGQALAIYSIGGTVVQLTKSSSTLYKRTNTTVSFNHSAGTCTVALHSDKFRRGATGDKYRWVVW